MNIGDAIAAVFDVWISQTMAPARAILTLIIALVGFSLILSPWDSGVAHWLKNSAIRIILGSAFIINAPGMAVFMIGSGAPATAAPPAAFVLFDPAMLVQTVALFGGG